MAGNETRLAAAARAVSFLVSQQKPDGSITDKQNATAMTALAIMAMASVGHQPNDPTPQGNCMRKGLQFVLTKQDKNGYFGNSDGSRMYAIWLEEGEKGSDIIFRRVDYR